jgi:hypothetical protein
MKSKFQIQIKLWMIMSVAGLALLWLSGSALLVRAETAANPTVTVLSPSGTTADTIGEGDDYFTQVLNDPRDMNNHEDATWQENGVDDISFANGVWSGNSTNTGGNSIIYFLFPGYTFAPPMASAAEIGKTGWNYPIQGSKYKQLSFRLRAPATGGWWHAVYSNVSATVQSGLVSGSYSLADWQVYTTTMTWGAGSIYGLSFRFGPNTGAYQFDWVRLTDPTTSPMYTIRFSVTNVQAGDLVDLSCYMSTVATADQYCGSIATGISVNTPGTYTYVWRTAYLAPGTYFVRATLRRGGANDMSDGPLTIRSAPRIKIDAPSMTSGPDYASVELGNPWDMNDASDIESASWHDFVSPCPCFSNGELTGVVERLDPTTTPGFGDPFVYLKISRKRPIDTAVYKYLTYRYKIDRTPWWPNSGDRLGDSPLGSGSYPAAWVVRLLFFGTNPPDLATSSNSTNDIIVFDDWNTYQMDLSKGVERGYWEPETFETGGYWTGLKYWLRFDFLEGMDPWTIHLDDVKLTGDDTADASFTVRWSDLSAKPTTIDIYASQNRATCLSGTHIYQRPSTGAPLPPAPGPFRVFLPLIAGENDDSSFTWNTSVVSAGVYYVCMRASDGHNTFTTTSETPVVISH